jgi:kynureninase
MMTLTRETCSTRDAADPLASLREQFAMARLDAEGLIYLDGNSLGVLPAAASARVREVVEEEWGVGLIRSWNSADWITLSQRVGDKIARLVGVGPGELIVADSTSINLYKVLSAAVSIVAADNAGAIVVGDPLAAGVAQAPPRRRIVSERTNFPTDLYIADTVARAHDLELVLVDTEGANAEEAIRDQLDANVAILMLTHVNYRTGRRLRMTELTRAAHDAGAIVIWDLAHSAGAVPVSLYGDASNDASSDVSAADFAIGCGYKYLNGGPGAPAFVWAHPRHLARMDREAWRQPLSGWMGHAAPFAFTPEYQPASGITRFLCGTPPILSLAALECGVDTILAAEAHGGLAALREKSIALTDLFIALVESRCAGHDLTLVTPRDADARGSQVSFAHPTGGYAIVQALIARGVIGDFRAPDILRFGFTPLYTRFVDVWDAVDRLARILESGEWREPRFSVRAAVT